MTADKQLFYQDANQSDAFIAENESALCIDQRSEHISDQPFCLPSLWLSMSYVCLFIDNSYYFVAILRNFWDILPNIIEKF